jgi:hypothetical protein
MLLGCRPRSVAATDSPVPVTLDRHRRFFMLAGLEALFKILSTLPPWLPLEADLRYNSQSK